MVLAKFFLSQKSPIRSPKELLPEVENELMRYSFPGNVRELEHIIERAIIFSEGNKIHAKDLNITHSEFAFEDKVIGDSDKIMKLENIEEIYIKRALNFHNWNRENTARALGISQKTLYTKIKKYNLK